MWKRNILLMLALVLLTFASAADADDPIVFADLSWDSAILQNRIAQYIVEKGYGYATAVLPGGTINLFPKLRESEADVMLELWLPNHVEKWLDATVAGEVVTLGESLSPLMQSAFTIPAYVQEAHPELDSVEDLREERFYSLFAADDSDGKAVLVTCPAGWSCSQITVEQVEGHGLADVVEVVVPADEADLHRGLFDAYSEGRPWLGYLDNIMAPSLQLDLVRLEEPPFTDLCWLTDKACAYEQTLALVMAAADLPVRAPDVAEMLRLWQLSVADYARFAVWRLENEATYAETALHFLGEAEAIWSEWVTDEAAVAINAALDAGESAAGWLDG